MNTDPAAKSAQARIYWFRNDLRLEDNAALRQACQTAGQLLFVYCHRNASVATRWNTPRTSAHRHHFLRSGLADLAAQLASQGSQLLEVEGDPAQVLLALARSIGATTIHCEEIAAPEEQGDLAALRAAGLTVEAVWQSSLLDPAALPFSCDALPDIFTNFRMLVERQQVVPPAPLARPATIPPLPPGFPVLAETWAVVQSVPHDAHPATELSSFPYALSAFYGGSTAAAEHLRQYFGRALAHTYKLTRNDLSGVDYSTKFSPWLACGALSARLVYATLRQFEAVHGANDGTYWIGFELLWRDYFRFLHLRHGVALYRAQGLGSEGQPGHDAHRFDAWRQARTGEPLIDAGMTELNATGYLSNRLRQIVASFLVHDLACDWRAGAAWFEAQLIDYDVYSNHGNWLYIAGRGTDPRNGRRFNLAKQMRDHDPDGAYLRRWARAAA